MRFHDNETGWNLTVRSFTPRANNLRGNPEPLEQADLATMAHFFRAAADLGPNEEISA